MRLIGLGTAAKGHTATLRLAHHGLGAPGQQISAAIARLVPRWRGRLAPRSRDSEPCFPTSCGRAITGPPSGFRSSCGSVWVSFCASCAAGRSSRLQPSSCRRTRIVQTPFGFNGRSRPIMRPLFQRLRSEKERRFRFRCSSSTANPTPSTSAPIDFHRSGKLSRRALFAPRELVARAQMRRARGRR